MVIKKQGLTLEIYRSLSPTAQEHVKAQIRANQKYKYRATLFGMDMGEVHRGYQLPAFGYFVGDKVYLKKKDAINSLKF